MCKIALNINVSNTTPTEAEGRYKLQGTNNYQPVFSIDLNNPTTDDITVIGVYDLEVRVKNSDNLWSDWFVDVIEVKSNCNAQPVAVNIGVGGCASIVTTFEVYVEDVNIQNGHIIYTDSNLSTTYNGGDNSHLYNNSDASLANRTFDVSTQGVVSNFALCTK